MTQPQQPFGEGPLTAMLRSHALDDDCRRLRAEVERLGQAQAV